MINNDIEIDVKKIQKLELEILLEFDRICRENDIKYQLFAGTLLGAYRHKGFIPWDDDIDVCLLREDYNRLIEVCKKSLDTNYFIQTYDTDINFIRQFAKIRKNNTVYREKVTKDINMHHGIFIDIFPLDKIQPDNIVGKFHLSLVYFLGRINLTRSKYLCSEIDNRVLRYISLIMHYTLRALPSSWFNRLQKKTCCIFNNRENITLRSHLTNGHHKNKVNSFAINEKDFYNTTEIEFEGYLFPVSRESKKLLKNVFDDFMKLPPLEKQVSHHGIVEVKYD